MLSSLDYPSDRYEVIIVDNNSTDGSFEAIREYVESRRSTRFKIVRLERNKGYCGANDGFRARDRDSKYVIVMNNDAIPRENSVRDLVEFMENHRELGGAQGVLVRRDSLIDTAGDFPVDIFYLITVPFLNRREISYLPNKPYYVSYADGALVIYRIRALMSIYSEEVIFPSVGIAYFDDVPTSLMLWNHGWKVAALNRIVGEHNRSTTYQRINNIQAYLGLRSFYALSILSDYRLKYGSLIFMARKLASPFILLNKQRSYILLKSFISGSRLGREMSLKGYSLDVSKIPIIRLKIADRFKSLASLKYLEREIDHHIRKSLAYLQ